LRIYCFTDLRHLLSVGVAIQLHLTASNTSQTTTRASHTTTTPLSQLPRIHCFTDLRHLLSVGSAI
jgi:hypothetical protein